MDYNCKSPELELRLNLSPPPGDHYLSSSTEVSLRSSCVSMEASPEACAMMLVGCPRCLMYVMLFEEDPKCPKCKSTILLDFTHDRAAITLTSTSM